ncbi:TetR/AcrR family transcriptional regulator [Citricoccus sp. SGAir0253]|uniref:TetR/AcrR family transcriptional regulator n=1 Tax=Citricoccus sp. SGAir0253 TaxID=2567881 RepID=UPI001AF009BB|nr:TetR/AcrR family transcriptional regulator [Citricoccus sp. SGAir0253]
MGAPSPGAAEQRGRPRSQRARVAVLTAAAELMVSGGFADLTVEGIAAAAGVGKQTVYRWWGSKADVVVEAVAEGYLTLPIVSLGDAGDLRADLAAWLRGIRSAIEEEDAARLVEAIMSALASAGETSEAIHQSLIRPIMAEIDSRFREHDRAHPGALPGPPSFLAETVGAHLLLHVMFGWPLGEERIGQLLDLVAPAAP